MNGQCKCGGKCKGGAVSNRAAIFLKKARAVARRCRSAGLPTPFTVNGVGQLVVNPAVSEAQRRYLNMAFGHDWVKEHHFDNHGPLPETVGDGKKKTDNENARRMGASSTTENNFFGRFFNWVTGNAGKGKSRGRDEGGQFSGGDDDADADATEAAEKGMSVEELRKQREAGPARNRRRELVTNARRCPECGGRMEDGECEECDYTENASLMVDQDADNRTISPKGGDADPDGRHTTKIRRRSPIDVIDDDGDPYLDEDDHSDLVREDQIRDTRNAQGYMGPDPHEATKHAVASTVMSEHTGARDHALEAMDSSSDDDSGVAAKMHLKAAKVHEDAATGARGDGEHMEADNHDQAAALHRKAASMHRASMSFNRWFATNMPAGGAFSGAKAAGYSAAQAAAMAGKLEGSYHGGEEHSGPSKEAKQASEHAERTKSRSAHRAAASAHKDAAEHHSNEGNTEMAASHASAARSHAAKAARMTRNRGEPTVNWYSLLMYDPLITNMPAGGAFSGAKAAGFSPAQAAAMAGKLEGSYHGAEEHSGPTKAAKEASSHAERTKSGSAHRKAAAAHKEAAEHHEGEGHTEMASSHRSAARSHAAKAGRAVRNERIVSLIENCTCPETRAGLQQLLVVNEPDAIGEEGGEIQVGGEEDDEFSDDNGLPDKVNVKKKKGFTGNAYLAQLPPDLRETITEARSVVAREKRALAHRLTVNVRNPARREMRIQQLMGRGLQELRGMLELIGNAAPGQGGDDHLMPLFGPDDTDIIDNAGGGDGDTLDCPTINFQAQKGRTA